MPDDAPSTDSTSGKSGLFDRLKQSFRHPNKTAVIGVVVAILTLVVGVMMYRRMQSGSSGATSAEPSSVTPADAGGGGIDMSGLLDAIGKAMGTAGGALPQPISAAADIPPLPVFDTSGSDGFGAPPVFSTGGSSTGGSAGDAGGGYTAPPSPIPTFNVPKLDLGGLGGLLSGGLSNVVRGEQTIAGTAGAVVGRILGTEKNIGQQLIAQPQEAARNLFNLGGKAATGELAFGKRVISTEQNVGKQIIAQPAELFHNTQAGAGYIAGQVASAEHNAIFNAPVIGGILQRITGQNSQPVVAQATHMAPVAFSLPTLNTAALRAAVAAIPRPTSPKPVAAVAPAAPQENPHQRMGGALA